MTTPDELATLWRRARRVVVLTGAGLSTASGIRSGDLDALFRATIAASSKDAAAESTRTARSGLSAPPPKGSEPQRASGSSTNTGSNAGTNDVDQNIVTLGLQFGYPINFD